MKRNLYLFTALRCSLALVLGTLAFAPTIAQETKVAAPAGPFYKSELNVIYCTVDGKDQKLNAFLPESAKAPVPAIVEIHGGWWSGGGPASNQNGVGGSHLFIRKGLAIFSIQYRLGKEGGFPENIRDCRNAIRFIRKNAARFNIDPERIAVTGGSAGGHLSLMVAMVPEDFADGGPTAGLEGISAKVCGSFSYIPPTDFLWFWDQGPQDATTNASSQVSLRGPNNAIPNDSRPRLRALFHDVAPDTQEHRALYSNMAPMGHVRKDVPPLLICDGEKDPIVPGLSGKRLHEKLKSLGADSTYWMTVDGGHGYPGGPGFDKVLEGFIDHALKLGTSATPTH